MSARSEALKAKYGDDYFKRLGRKGAQATHSKYKIGKVGVNKFVYVDRVTNKAVGKPWS